MKRLFFIVDIASGCILTDPYQTKGGLLRDYAVEAGERIVELNYDDMETKEQKTQFNRLWEMRVKR